MMDLKSYGKWTQKKSFWIITLLAFVFAAQVFFAKKDPSVQSLNSVSKQDLPLPAEKKDSMTESISQKEQLRETYSDHLMAVSQLDEHPELTEVKLKKFAQEMSEADLKKLHQKTLDSHLSGDDRWLAIYLLSLSDANQSISLLEDVALSPSPSLAHDLGVEFEKSIRAQAIEGLENSSNKKMALMSLNKLSQRLDDRFLLDRVHRALLHLEKGSLSLEEQDRKALENLVQ